MASVQSQVVPARRFLALLTRKQPVLELLVHSPRSEPVGFCSFHDRQVPSGRDLRGRRAQWGDRCAVTLARSPEASPSLPPSVCVGRQPHLRRLSSVTPTLSGSRQQSLQLSGVFMPRNPRPKNVDPKHLWTGAETALATWK